jgi:hypothetical protein
MHDQTVRTLAREGVLTRSGRHFQYPEVIRQYARHMRGLTRARGGETAIEVGAAARARVATLRADRMQFELDRERGQFVVAADMERALKRAFRLFRDGMLAFSSTLPWLDREAHNRLLEAIRQLLTDFADGKLDYLRVEMEGDDGASHDPLDDGDRLTVGELSQWTENSVAEIQELERLGVIERDAGGLFPLPETVTRLADYREAELQALKAAYVPTWRYVLCQYGRLFTQLALWLEYAVLKRMIILPMLCLLQHDLRNDEGDANQETGRKQGNLPGKRPICDTRAHAHEACAFTSSHFSSVPR